MQLHMFMTPLTNNYSRGYYPSNEGFMDSLKDIGNAVLDFIKKVFFTIIDFFKYKVFRMKRPEEPNTPMPQAPHEEVDMQEDSAGGSEAEVVQTAVATVETIEELKETVADPEDEYTPEPIKQQLATAADSCISRIKRCISAGKVKSQELKTVYSTAVADLFSKTQSVLISSVQKADVVAKQATDMTASLFIKKKVKQVGLIGGLIGKVRGMKEEIMGEPPANTMWGRFKQTLFGTKGGLNHNPQKNIFQKGAAAVNAVRTGFNNTKKAIDKNIDKAKKSYKHNREYR